MRTLARVRVRGPLAGRADGFRAELDRLGYTPVSAQRKLYEMAHLSLWLGDRGLGAGDLTAPRAAAFLADRRATGREVLTLSALAPLLGWLSTGEVIGSESPEPPGAVDELLDRYRRWLMTERGLAARTVGRYDKTAARFLAERAAATGDPTGVKGLTAGEVTAFLLAEADRGLSAGSLQGRVAELRSLLRFLYLRGLTDRPLAGGIPRVPGWRDTTVPPARVPAGQVRRLVDSCDPATLKGARDRAMLMLLARLGLRAAEVASLRVGDVDWHAGELLVRGKSARVERLPLPVDVGEAVVAYLLARPVVAIRAVFLTVPAPRRPLGATAVSEMVAERCRQAGLPPIRSHRLRHTLATDLLERGVKLPEIAQVLRHRDLATTAVYAKVDHARLRTLARPWPGTGR